ncbi:hypothetical protein BCR33DRAFT_490401 [Rhizoclosmatium globosum]|uniref:Uncharacterized protein n=1 Tax=Rhizoclosmatium globosum TaxID=329046 RepID=A0A1Y2BMY8_9FUNG|nr:hypothetical protein BCR33DRAFT_490401 [Rhizoclosmatium globosum]|eukprot:ORY35957.1 hypothetical protein BCR33DRAFT_490401 [Rhizoclosmatium globosum]
MDMAASSNSLAAPSTSTLDLDFLDLDSLNQTLLDPLSSSTSYSTSAPKVWDMKLGESSSSVNKPAPVVAMMSPMISAPSTKKVGGGRKKRTSIYKATEEIAAEEELTDSETVVFSAAKNPTEVFSQAAAKASTRRRTVEEPISCISCSAIIGVLELRGTPASFEAAYAVSIRCKLCCSDSLDANSSSSRRSSIGNGVANILATTPTNTMFMSSSSTNRKRRGAPEAHSPADEVLSCQVCKRATAQGCVKMRAPAASTSSPLHRSSDPSLSVVHAPTVQEPVWISPDFAISLICDSCHTKYLFCSECGGGGKQRTGKYRPRALFPLNRRTCSLPHIRIGTTQVSHRVLEAPITQPDVLEGVRDVFFDCLVSLYAVPGVLEGVDEDSGTAGLSSLARIHADVEGLWSSTVRDAIVSMFPKGLAGGKIYVTVAWIEKRNRNKGKGIVGASKKKKEEEEERIPWLLRLAMEGTVAPLKEKEEVGASSVLAALPILPEPSADEMNGDVVGVEKTYVSFAVSEWDRARGALFVLQMAPRSVYLPTMESYGDLLRRNIERVQADSRRDNAPPLEHIWCWTRNLSHSRLRSIPERLGFVPLEQYIREHPGVDRSTFVREGYKPLQEEGVSLHVTNVRKFMQMMMKKSKK